MLTALTGTPGTGKTVVGNILREMGFEICDISELAMQSQPLMWYDRRRGSQEVDLERLGEAIPKERPLVLVGHLAHLLPVDLSIVLRCHPETLRNRLEAKGWAPPKVQENVEAEALGVIAYEAMDRGKAFEVDTTSAPPEETAKAVLDILTGKGERYIAGAVDWSEVILGWY